MFRFTLYLILSVLSSVPCLGMQATRTVAHRLARIGNYKVSLPADRSAILTESQSFNAMSGTPKIRSRSLQNRNLPKLLLIGGFVGSLIAALDEEEFEDNKG